MAPGNGPPQPTDSLRRRGFLSLAIGSGSTALAGCASLDSGGDGAGSSSDGSGTADEGTDSSTEETGGPTDPTPAEDAVRFETFQPGFVVEEYDWNPLTWYSPTSRHGVFAQWTQYLVGEDRFHPHLVTDWRHHDGETVLDIAERFRWASSGDPVTAQDLARQLDVYDAGDRPATRFLEDWRATDRFELTVSYPAETNPELIEYSLLPQLADVAPRDWSDGDREDPAADRIEAPDASGPIAFAGVHDSVVEYTVRDRRPDVADHPLTTQFNWAGYSVPSFVYSVHQSLIAGEGDGIHSLFTTPETREQFPGSTREITFPAAWGMAFAFDHERELWSRREARQAFLHAMDRTAAIEDLGANTKLRHPAPTGLSAATAERWLGEEPTTAGYRSYGGGPERARELLAEIGRDPADIEVRITYPQAWSDWAVVCQSIVEGFAETDWTVEGDPRSGGPVEAAEDGEFDVLAHRWAPGVADSGPVALRYHPYFPLEYLLGGGADGLPGGYDPGTVAVDGGGLEVDVPAALAALRTAESRAAQRPIVRRLARVVNEAVPCAIVMEKRVQSFMDTERFRIPEESPHLQSRWPQWWLPKVEEQLPSASEPGLMKYTGE